MQHFGPIFIFCRIELIFGRLTCFDMKSIIALLFLLICTSLSRNNVCKRTQFSERHLLERILPRWMLTQCKLKRLLLAASTARFFKIDVLIFERSREIDRKKKNDRPHIKPVSRQNKLASGQFSALFACANKATVRE